MSGILSDNTLLLWLQDESNNDFKVQESMAGIYSYFTQGADDPLDSIKGDDRHHCFLTFQKNKAGISNGTIVHHLAKAPSRMGVTTIYDGKWYMTAGQPICGQQIIPEVPADLFREVGPVQCYTPDRIQRELGNTLDATQLEYVVEDANLPDLVAVSTQRAMWIPNSYAALCLEDNPSLVDVWNRVYGALLQNGHALVCAPLIQFMQYQLMGTGAANVALYNETELPQPRVTADFLRHRSNLLGHLKDSGMHSTSRSSNATAASGGPTGGPFRMSTTQFQAIVEAMRGGQTSPAPSASSTAGTTVTVEKWWSINLPTLLKLSQVDDIDLLPPVWATLAKGPRKEE